MNKFLSILIVFFSFNLYSQTKEADTKFEWNGYAQVRASSNFDDLRSFSLRRMKLWVKSTPEFSEHWSYKIQTIISSFSQEKFVLQDAQLSYKTGIFSFDLGQFVPAYGLEWSQPDYFIPSMERAKVVDAITPNGTLGVRDIGVQVNLESKNSFLKTSFGIFNGYGIKEYCSSGNAYMLTHKTTFAIPLRNNQLQIGYSLQYRKAQQLSLLNILPDSVLFSGDDFRYNFFLLFKYRFIEFQAEYLNANLENQIASGYYFLSTLNFKKNQIVISYEDYHDLIPETSDKPFYRIGYNYLINKHKLKLSFDTIFQLNNNKIEKSITSIQLQMFFK